MCYNKFCHLKVYEYPLGVMIMDSGPLPEATQFKNAIAGTIINSLKFL